MADFVTIQNRVKSYVLDLPTETDSLIKEWIIKAQKTAMELTDFRIMRRFPSFPTSSGLAFDDRRLVDDVFSEAAPSAGIGFKFKKFAKDRPYYRDENGEAVFLNWIPTSEHIAKYSSGATLVTGPPEDIAFNYDQQTAELIVGPIPDVNGPSAGNNYDIFVPSIAYLDDLDQDNDTNWFTENAEWYLTWFATAEAMFFNRDAEQALVYARKTGVDVAQGEALVDSRGRFIGELGRIVKADKKSVRPAISTLNISFDAGARP